MAAVALYAARYGPGASLGTARSRIFVGIVICIPLLVTGAIAAYYGKVFPVNANNSAASRLMVAARCEAAEKAIVAAGAIPGIDECLDPAAGQNATTEPGGSAMHSITVKFDYDFTHNPVCTEKSRKDACVATFIIYDISNPKAYKLFSIPAPAGSYGAVKGITATSPRMLFGVGKHRIGVAAVAGNGRESPPVDCNVIVEIKPAEASSAAPSK
jgi:hypothetical protein